MRKRDLWFLMLSWAVLGRARRANKKPLEELQLFLLDNGHHYVDLFHNLDNIHFNLMRTDVFFSMHSFGSLKKENRTRDNRFGIFLYDNAKDNMKDLLKIIQDRPIRKSLLLFNNSQNDMHVLHSVLTKMKLRTFFYIALCELGQQKMLWYQVISLTSGFVIDQLVFQGSSYLISEKFNLKGLKVTSTTLTWAPYYAFENCNEDGVDCNTFGYLHDYVEILARRYNFTLVSHKNPENEWGSIPQDGKWLGVLGDVVSKKYDLSISTWSWKTERLGVLQFVVVAKTRYVQVLTPSRPTTDLTLFTRVFTNRSWLAIASTVGIAMFCIALRKSVIPSENTNGEKLFNLTMFLFFVILNSYYGGALTMFFAGTVSVSFEKPIDVLREYPEWNYWFHYANINDIYKLRGESGYAEFWCRYLADKSGHTYTSEKEALEIMTRGKNVAQFDEAKFIGYLKTNPTEQKLHFFGPEPWDQRCLVFYHNSPLVPIFDQGARHLREMGIEHQIHTDWIGQKPETTDSYSDTMVLTIGQTVATFLFILGSFGLSLILLCGECVLDSTRKNRHKWLEFFGRSEEDIG